MRKERKIRFSPKNDDWLKQEAERREMKFNALINDLITDMRLQKTLPKVGTNTSASGN